MVFAFNPDRNPRRAFRSGRWFLASVFIHAAIGALLLRFATFPPAGAGGGIASAGSLSLTWIPGRGGDPNEHFDTAVGGSGAEELTLEPATEPPRQIQQATSLIKAAELDPREIFQVEPETTFKEDVESRIDRDRGSIRLVSSTDASVSRKSLASPKTVPVEMNSTELDPEPRQRNERNEPKVGREHGSQAGSGKGKAGQAGERGGAGNSGHEVGFFGIFTRARRVVYVIDASESMRKQNAIGLARQELLESLRSLESTAYFQIVFFDVTPHAMNRAKDRRGLLQATSSNLRLAEHFMKGIQPDAGTDRFAALKQAFSFEPDAIFLLTDADEPVLSERELKEIVRLNKRRTPIHVVEYSLDGGEQEESFLQSLAEQNHGQHYFCDVKEWAAAMGSPQK